MSTFTVEVVVVGPVEKHPNADSLGITMVGEYPVIVRLGDTVPGSVCAYVPIDAVCPPTGPTAFLADPSRPSKPIRVKAKRLRGVFSMGLLIPAPAGSNPGDDVAAALGIVKYEEPEQLASTGGEDARAPVQVPVFDVDGWRGHSRMLEEGETVEFSEKVHGCNARYLVHEGVLHAASRTRFKAESDDSVWWRAAKHHDLATKLAGSEGFAFYGEVYGQVQDLKYGVAKGGALFVAFDVLRIATREWLNVDDARAMCEARGIPFVPCVYRGPYTREAVLAHTSGPTIVGNGAHFREGIVIRPIAERNLMRGGRAILKNVSEEYLLRKGGTEHQ